MKKELLYLLFVSLIAGCTPRTIIEKLDRAEHIMNSQPDSALYLLKTIENSDLYGKEDNARYALLYSQALDKNVIDSKNDSMARIAVEYYKDNGSDLNRAKAYYYLGRIYENNSDTDQTIININLAQEVVPDSAYYMKGLIYSKLGTLFYDQNNFKKAINYYTIVLKAYIDGEVLHNEASEHNQLAKCYRVMLEFDLSLEHEKKALAIYTRIKDTSNMLYTLRGIEYSNQLRGDNPREILRRMHQYYPWCSDDETKNMLDYFISNLYARIGNNDSTKHYLNLSSNYLNSLTRDTLENLYDSAAKMLTLRRLAKSENDYKKAFEYQSELFDIKSAIDKEKRKTLVEAVIEKYKAREFQQKFETQRKKSRTAFAIFVLVGLLLILVIYLVYVRYKKQIQEQSDSLSAAQELTDKISKSLENLKLIHNNLEMKGLAQTESFSMLMPVIINFVENIPLYDKKPRKFIDEFKSTVNFDAQSYSEPLLFSIVNCQYRGALSHLAEVNKLKSYEVSIITLVCLGFTNSAISILLNHCNPKTIYVYRAHLKNKLNVPIDEINLKKLLESVK